MLGGESFDGWTVDWWASDGASGDGCAGPFLPPGDAVSGSAGDGWRAGIFDRSFLPSDSFHLCAARDHSRIVLAHHHCGDRLCLIGLLPLYWHHPA